MPRYIDADALTEHMRQHCDELFEMYGDYDHYTTGYDDAVDAIDNFPTADVAPKSEVDNLEYTLMGVMHSVDKWLDGDELKQDEVNRAIAMREKTLRIIESVKIEVAREIYEEMAKFVGSKIPPQVRPIFKNDSDFERGFRDGKTDALIEVFVQLAELKKKYTEGQT